MGVQENHLPIVYGVKCTAVGVHAELGIVTFESVQGLQLKRKYINPLTHGIGLVIPNKV